jgi:glycosyltransferase involved in cell wall biosynthesis
MVSISSYTTTYNCIERQYPLELCIESLLGFSDQVSIVDGGSTDGTLELLEKLARRDSRVSFYVSPVDFTHPRWAIYMDGYLKAKARARCTGDFCWQTDTDEIVAPHDFPRIRKLPELLAPLFEEVPIVYLPMVEFWGSFERIRADFFTWKQRLSKNDPRITHGIPHDVRVLDDTGHEYPRPFDSDSCNYIYRDTKESVRSIVPVEVPNFSMPPEVFKPFFEESLSLLPSVLHVSWLNLKRKIEHYRDFWPKFHQSMYNLAQFDDPENNVMFSKAWRDVTDQDIAAKAQELNELGPRSFHHKMNPHQKGATVSFAGKIPDSLRVWAAQNY